MDDDKKCSEDFLLLIVTMNKHTTEELVVGKRRVCPTSQGLCTQNDRLKTQARLCVPFKNRSENAFPVFCVLFLLLEPFVKVLRDIIKTHAGASMAVEN